MTTIEQIEEFSRFARAKGMEEGEAASIDSLYDRWRQQTFQTQDRLAVAASLRDVGRKKRDGVHFRRRVSSAG